MPLNSTRSRAWSSFSSSTDSFASSTASWAVAYRPGIGLASSARSDAIKVPQTSAQTLNGLLMEITRYPFVLRGAGEDDLHRRGCPFVEPKVGQANVVERDDSHLFRSHLAQAHGLTIGCSNPRHVHAGRAIAFDCHRIAAQRLLGRMTYHGVTRFLFDAAGPGALDLKCRPRSHMRKSALRIDLVAEPDLHGMITELAQHLLASMLG